MGPMGIKMQQENSPVACDGYVKYEEAETDILAITILNGRQSGFGCYCCKIWHGQGYPCTYCMRPYILFIMYGSAILHCF